MAFFFPGQGAQTVGMAVDLCAEVPAAKDLFDRASEILGYDLLQTCAEGPKARLDSTAVSQPAIYVASLAAVEKLRKEQGEVRRAERGRTERSGGAAAGTAHAGGAGLPPRHGAGCSPRSASSSPKFPLFFSPPPFCR